ncbi:hypothetical protein Tco_1099703 [Tanacetum coccineum]
MTVCRESLPSIHIVWLLCGGCLPPFYHQGESHLSGTPQSGSSMLSLLPLPQSSPPSLVLIFLYLIIFSSLATYVPKTWFATGTDI